ncbi:MAG: DoxX family membrane protein [Tannerella sp.]|jgi:uncharacterized membrane protein YphA (DoxX/SURF4 family)|nr:DoxX family membrane protein [Tannerella sp.]
MMKTVITVLRIAVGWHFLYEGYVKVAVQGWTSEGFLSSSVGFLSDFYHWLAASPVRLQVTDWLNMLGLILVGLALFTGYRSKWAALGGALLLGLYYCAFPPFGLSLLNVTDENAFVVNKLLIEALVLFFLFCNKERGYGLDSLLQFLKNRPAAQHGATPPPEELRRTRREVIRNLVSLPVLGMAGWGARQSYKLYGADVLSGATLQIRRTALNELKGELPTGQIGNHTLSRLIMGGNLIGGYAHSRDLNYVHTLFRNYNTEKKIFETLILGEQAGINAINIAYSSMPVLAKYKKLTGSKLKVIVQVEIYEEPDRMYSEIDEAVDCGMDILQLWGGVADICSRDNKPELLHRFLDRARGHHGYVAGLGAHVVDSLIFCEQNGIIPDYIMKTMHHDNYWSAHPRENRTPYEMVNGDTDDHNRYHDNLFCPYPERTVEYIRRTRIPLMGFKVLAGGAIQPHDGFEWAFRNGADFICVGMFDFQLVEDVNTCIDVLQKLENRQRDWYG